ncbi:DUF6221 family protein [Streptomyces sp. NPDC047081]|uniref:DUF6221 family protein n=1 Tax=Streptomyces sp. NPDC047081 TaxID=3154706 RepID=UPI003409A35B
MDSDLVGFLRARLDEDAVVARHVALHDPVRVLREVEAKRRVLSRHALSPAAGDPERPWDDRDDCQFDGEPWPCADLLDLALPYLDHPDFPARHMPNWRSDRMPQNPELHIWFLPAGGEALAVKSRDFESLESAESALREALEQGRTLRFQLTDSEDTASGVALVNFANVVAVKVWPESVKGADHGQYL